MIQKMKELAVWCVETNGIFIIRIDPSPNSHTFPAGRLKSRGPVTFSKVILVVNCMTESDISSSTLLGDKVRFVLSCLLELGTIPSTINVEPFTAKRFHAYIHNEKKSARNRIIWLMFRYKFKSPTNCHTITFPSFPQE